MDRSQLFPDFNQFRHVETYRPAPHSPVPVKQRRDFIRYLHFICSVMTAFLNNKVVGEIAASSSEDGDFLAMSSISPSIVWGIALELEWLEEAFLDQPALPILRVLSLESSKRVDLLSQFIIDSAHKRPLMIGFVNTTGDNTVRDIQASVDEKLEMIHAHMEEAHMRELMKVGEDEQDAIPEA